MEAEITQKDLSASGRSRAPSEVTYMVAFCTAVAAAAAMYIGWLWDISWHRAIGRDTLWTLPHICIYISLFIAFVYNAWMVLTYTFGGGREEPAIRIYGFRGPSASFVTMWAILAQYTCIVFDDWWHDAYGLDSQVFTPPHFVLGTAIAAFYMGQVMMVAWLGNTHFASRPQLFRWGILIIWSMALGNSLIGADALYGPAAVRAPAFLLSGSVILGFVFATVREQTRWRWSVVSLAGLYMIMVITVMQVFMLFPATPQFGPVYHPLTRFAPPPFPIWLPIPALVLTLFLEKARSARGWGRTLRNLAASAAFVVVFTVTNWISSGFMLSPLSHNRFFAGDYPATAFLEGVLPTRILQPDLGGLLVVLATVVVTAAALFAGSAFGRWLNTVVR